MHDPIAGGPLERGALPEPPLLDAEACLRLMIDCAVGSAFMLLNAEGAVASWNDGAARLTGYAADEIIGRHVRTLHMPDDVRRGRAARSLDAAALAGRYEEEGWRLRKNGSSFPAHVHVIAVRGPQGELRGFAKMIRDLSAQYQAQTALQQAAEERERRIADRSAELARNNARALTRVEERFRRVVEAAPNGMVMVRADGSIEMVNAQAERMFGYSRAEMLGRPVEMLIPARFVAGHPALRASFAAEPDVRPMGAGRELHGLRKDGSEFPVEIGLNPIETEDGMMVLSSVTDITDRVQLEAQLRQAQKMEAVGRLTAGVAHDFNNLLQTMMGGLELLRDRIAGDAASDELLTMAIHAAAQGGRLTHHLLAFSRKQMLRPSGVAIGALLTHCAAMLQRTLGPGVDLVTEAPDEGLAAFADPAQLESCILNLAINARDAMPRGGRLEMQARAASISEEEASETLRAGDYMLLSVRDTGTGMSPQVLERVFEPFFTTKGVGKGSGLGLPMVLGYARQSGGDVRITSAPGQGTLVELLLPRQAPGEPVAPARAPRRERLAGRVLLVDDAPDVLVTLGAFLDGAGFEVVKARGGDEALAAAAPGRLDALITDFAMPGLSGADLLQQVGALRPGLPVLVVTGYPGIDGLAELPPGVQVLHKPFQREELLERLRLTLEQARDAGRNRTTEPC